MNNNAMTAPGYTKPLGYVQITSLSSAVGLGTIPAGAQWALIQPETQSIRYRDDGTNPTSSVGMILAAGSFLQLTSALFNFKAIEVSASAKLNVTFYG